MDSAIAIPVAGEAVATRAEQQSGQAAQGGQGGRVVDPPVEAGSGLGFVGIEHGPGISIRKAAKSEGRAFYVRTEVETGPTLTELAAKCPAHEKAGVMMLLKRAPVVHPYLDLQTSPLQVTLDMIQCLSQRLTYRIHAWMHKYMLEQLGGDGERLLSKITMLFQGVGVEVSGWGDLDYEMLVSDVPCSSFHDDVKATENGDGSQGYDLGAATEEAVVSEAEMGEFYARCRSEILFTDVDHITLDWIARVVQVSELGTLGAATPKRGILLAPLTARACLVQGLEWSRRARNVSAHLHSSMLDFRFDGLLDVTGVCDDLEWRFAGNGGGKSVASNQLGMEPRTSWEFVHLETHAISLRRQVIVDIVSNAEHYSNTYLGGDQEFMDKRVLQAAALPFLFVYQEHLKDKNKKNKRKNQWR